LQAPSGVALNGKLSLTFTNGFQPATNDAFTLITAGAVSGHFASFDYPSNTVSMQLSNTPAAVIAFVTGLSTLSPPVLHLERIAGTSGRLYWATNYTGYHLEYAALLRATNWAASGFKPVVTGTNFVLTNTLSGAHKFYRLSQVPATFVPPPPTLQAQRISSGLLRLLWPVDNDQPFLLQGITNLSATNWASVLPVPATLGSNNVVTNAIIGSQRFYRLSLP
jgi:hypothetical protein